jgi:hypothetical protein
MMRVRWRWKVRKKKREARERASSSHLPSMYEVFAVVVTTVELGLREEEEAAAEVAFMLLFDWVTFGPSAGRGYPEYPVWKYSSKSGIQNESPSWLLVAPPLVLDVVTVVDSVEDDVEEDEDDEEDDDDEDAVDDGMDVALLVEDGSLSTPI